MAKSKKPASAAPDGAAEAIETKATLPALPDETFQADGVEYKFVVPKFNIPGLGVFTAYEALLNDEALAYLVEVQSGVIEPVTKGE